MNIFKRYIDNSKDNPKGLWFKRKTYGWGWTPVTLEGWVITFVYIFLLILFVSQFNATSTVIDAIVLFFLPGSIITGIFFYILYKKGEKPRWQWGKRKK
jgi:hypothetical protein